MRLTQCIILLFIENYYNIRYTKAMENIKRKDGFQNQILFVIPGNIIKKAKKHPLGENLMITDIGYFPNAENHYRERKKGCNQHILIYCTEGLGFIEMNNKRELIRENSLVYIPANTPHSYGSNEDDPWSIYWAHFAGSKANSYYSKPGEVSNVPINKIPLVNSLFSSIFENMEKGYSIDNIIYSCQTFAYLLSSFLFFNKKDIAADRQANQINNTVMYMRSNLHKNPCLAELAKLNNLSKSQLTLIFRHQTGHTPIDYLIHLKIQQACRYLDLSDMNIKEIAESLGYNDPYYFSRVFKKIMGTAPTEYRKIKKG